MRSSSESVEATPVTVAAQAEAIARELDAVKASGQFRFAWDFRPHTHPFYMLAQIRKSQNEAASWTPTSTAGQQSM